MAACFLTVLNIIKNEPTYYSVPTDPCINQSDHYIAGLVIDHLSLSMINGFSQKAGEARDNAYKAITNFISNIENDPDKESRMFNVLTLIADFMINEFSDSFQLNIFRKCFDASLRRQIGEDKTDQLYFKLPRFYLKKLEPYQKVQTLKTTHFNTFIETNWKLTIINPVIDDGFGDFVSTLSLINMYCKNFKFTQINWIICTTDTERDRKNIAAIKIVFEDAMKQLKNLYKVQIDFDKIDEDPIRNSPFSKLLFDLQNQLNNITIITPTGDYEPFYKNFIDRPFNFINEQGLYHPEPENEYARDKNKNSWLYWQEDTRWSADKKITTRYGFTPMSAGVLLDKISDISFEKALTDSGLVNKLMNIEQVNSDKISEFLKDNIVTLCYLKGDNAISQYYYKFLNEYAKLKQKPIHVISVGKNKIDQSFIDALQNIKIHFVEPFNGAYFKAILQNAPFPPAITGCSSLYEALSAAQPFFYDNREHMCKIIKELQFFSQSMKNKLPKSFLEYLESIAKISNEEEGDYFHCDIDPENLASHYASNEKEIKKGFITLKALIEKHCNAKNFLCNDLLRQINEKSNLLKETSLKSVL